MSVFDKFEEVRLNRHQYAQEWKERTGRPVFGYFCTYAPEELIHAAGILPVRVLGSHEPVDVTEPYIPSQWCPYCRDALAQGLLGRYDYVDGLVYAFACAHIWNTYLSWTRHHPPSYYYHIYIPEHFYNPHARGALIDELRDFKQHFEKWLGRPITDADLDRTIEVYNTNIQLQHQIYETRKGPNPLITGTEAHSMVIAGQLMDKEEHTELLRQALEEIKGRQGIQDVGARVIILGSENDDVGLTRFIESLGTTVVIDETCGGSRYFWQPITPQEDRVAAIADRYISRPPCAHKDLVDRQRLHFIKERVEEYNAQGAIFILQKFCDIYEFDIPAMEKMLRNMGIPLLTLEMDVTTPYGQFSTRVEAFLETLELELV
jgi:benzoyl-CoA reductase subunit C